MNGRVSGRECHRNLPAKRPPSATTAWLMTLLRSSPLRLPSQLLPPCRARVLSTASSTASAALTPNQLTPQWSPWSAAAPPPQAAYLHIPFCRRRCFYCDFPIVTVGDRERTADAASEAYAELLLREIMASPAGDAAGESASQPASHSVSQGVSTLHAHCTYTAYRLHIRCRPAARVHLLWWGHALADAAAAARQDHAHPKRAVRPGPGHLTPTLALALALALAP